MYPVTLSSKGQLTVPKKVRDTLKLKEGQILLIQLTGRGALLRKAEIRPAQSEFSDDEWEALSQLTHQKGKRYKSGKRFLTSLK